VVADVATRGEDALWMAGATEFDAVVLDLRLPGDRWVRDVPAAS
jgi:two-component system OmpR family response regulator